MSVKTYTIAELHALHGISVKNITKHCKKPGGCFKLGDIEYIAKNIAAPGARRAKWQIAEAAALASPEPPPESVAPLAIGDIPAYDADETGLAGLKMPSTFEDIHRVAKIKKDTAARKKIEQEIKERKIQDFREYLELEREALMSGFAPVRDFVRDLDLPEEKINEWNEITEALINDVYGALSAKVSDLL